MKPRDFEHATGKVLNDDGSALPVNRVNIKGQTFFVSIWRASWLERLAVLFTGDVQLVVCADKHPVVAMAAGFDIIEYELPTRGG